MEKACLFLSVGAADVDVGDLSPAAPTKGFLRERGKIRNSNRDGIALTERQHTLMPRLNA